MDKRYQVFVSSTFEDLREERKVVIEALLNARYIPAGMEMFSASNDEQFEYIKKIIDTCDYYVLIIAARYGSINPSTGISFTEQEYNYAVEKGIPVLVFFHSDPYNLPFYKREDDKRELLEKFKKKALSGRLCRTWTNPLDLTSAVIISLGEQVKHNPQRGWTREITNSFTDDNKALMEGYRVQNERLQKKIEQLEVQLREANKKIDLYKRELCNWNDNNMKVSKIEDYIEPVPMDFKEHVKIKFLKDGKSGVLSSTWREIFFKIVKPLEKGCSAYDFGKFLSKQLIFGEGEIFIEDVEKITNYLINNSLCYQDGNKIKLVKR